MVERQDSDDEFQDCHEDIEQSKFVASNRGAYMLALDRRPSFHRVLSNYICHSCAFANFVQSKQMGWAMPRLKARLPSSNQARKSSR